jgi:hypothetical protein
MVAEPTKEFGQIQEKKLRNKKSQLFQKTLDKRIEMCYTNYSKGEIKMKKEKYIGKSKREIMAMISADEKVFYYESRKGIPQLMEIFGKGYHYFLIFDKTTRRVVA